MTEPTYYVPELSEFHVGFEYEEYIDGDFDTHTKTGWDKTEVDADTIFGSIARALSLDFIRVRHLDHEEIEQCGWIKTNIYFESSKSGEIEPREGYGFGPFFCLADFVYPEFSEPEDMPEITIYKKHEYSFKYELYSCGHIATITIRNKSELKFQMARLGIKK